MRRWLNELVLYLVETEYLSAGKIEWKNRQEFQYIIQNLIILQSAKKIYAEYGFAPHFSSRIIQEALKDFGYHGKEEANFNLNNFKNQIVIENWNIKKISLPQS